MKQLDWYIMTTTIPTPNRQQRRTAATRQKLIVAARANFAKKGVAGTNLQDITDTADVALGTFYNHFESKEHLLQTLVEITLAFHEERILKIAELIEDPAEISYIGTRDLIEQLLEDSSTRWLLQEPELLLDKIIDAIRPHSLQVIKDALELGQIKIDVSPETFQYFIFWALIGLLNAQQRKLITLSNEKLLKEYELLALRLYNVSEEQIRKFEKNYKRIVRSIAKT